MAHMSVSLNQLQDVCKRTMSHISHLNTASNTDNVHLKSGDIVYWLVSSFNVQVLNNRDDGVLQ